MLNFREYIHEKTVNDLVKNCADIDLFSVIEKGKIQLFTSFFLILNNLSYNIKPAPIASVIPYADIIDPITIISVFVAYFLNFILSPTKK